MKRRMGIAGIIATIAIIAWVAISRSSAVAAEDAKPGIARQGVELTVYSQDFAMVHEARPVSLVQGANRLSIPDVSKQLDPQSVLLGWQGGAMDTPDIIAHAYDLGAANGEGLLKRYLGQEVEVVRYGENGHEAERQRGRLMVESNGEVVIQSEGKFYVHPPGTIVMPASPDVVTIPQLSVQAQSAKAQQASLDVAYLTRGLSWSADYVATLAPQGDTIKLDCYATVTNQAGVDFPNAKVTLVAGTPNRAVRRAEDRTRAPAAYADGYAMRKQATLAAENSIAAYVPESMGEFYAYPVKENTSVVQDRMNRLLILTGKSVPVVKDYSATPPPLHAWVGYYGWGHGSRPQRGNVQVALSFQNTEQGGLGAPLPAGAMRLYEPDRHGMLRYAGAATIENTPKDQKVNVALSRAFDVFTEGRIVKSQRIDKRTTRREVELLLHNEKPSAIDLRVVQSFDGLWKVAEESHKHMKLHASAVQWKVTVPAGGKVPLRYTVDFTH
jgi:hypothetical protein